MQGSVDTSVGYTEYLKTVASEQIFYGVDSENTGAPATDWNNAQYNAWANYEADTTLGARGSGTFNRRRLRGTYYNYYGNRGALYQYGYYQYTVTATDKTNIQMLKLKIAGRHSTWWWYWPPGYWGDFQNYWNVYFQFTESPTTFSSGQDLFDNHTLDYSIAWSQLNKQWDNAGRQWWIDWATPGCYLYMDLDASIVSSMTGLNLYMWTITNNSNFPYDSLYATHNQGNQDMVIDDPELAIYY